MLYSIGAGNPEGTDFEILLQHEKVFTKQEFNEMCEEAFCLSLEKQYNKTGSSFIFSCADDIIEHLKSKGFVDPPPTMCYYVEPYWGKENITSTKLLELIDRPDDEEKHNAYMESLKKNDTSISNNNK
jgi:hypothetical protein